MRRGHSTDVVIFVSEKTLTKRKHSDESMEKKEELFVGQDKTSFLIVFFLPSDKNNVTKILKRVCESKRAKSSFFEQ